MSNWAERAENERQRLAAEAAIVQREAEIKSQADAVVSERLRREQEAIIQQKLQLFNQLEMTKKLEEIRRDLFKSRGKVKVPETFVYTDGGTTRVAFETAIETIGSPKDEDIYRQVNGPYSRTVETQGSSWSTPAKGWHDEYVGKKLIGGNTYTVDFNLGGGLSFKLSTDEYQLYIAQQQMKFKGSSLNIVDLKKFIDSSLLAYAINLPDTADIIAIENMARKRNVFVAQHKGEVISGYGDVWLERMQREDLFSPGGRESSFDPKTTYIGNGKSTSY